MKFRDAIRPTALRARFSRFRLKRAGQLEAVQSALNRKVVVRAKPYKTKRLLDCAPADLRAGANYSRRTAKRLERKGIKPKAAQANLEAAAKLDRLADRVEASGSSVVIAHIGRSAKEARALLELEDLAERPLEGKLPRPARGIAGQA